VREKCITGTGFRLKIIKFSARPVKNRVNLCAKIRSISSACLIFILIRMELMEGSMSTCSFSLRAICIGFNIISVEVLYISMSSTGRQFAWGRYLASTSGMLCRSTT